MKCKFVFILISLVECVCALQVFNYTDCKRHSFAPSFVDCVCTESYCDGFNGAEGTVLSKFSFAVYTSSEEGERMKLTLGVISPHMSEDHEKLVLHVENDVKYQEMLGFGGAFTDAATMNIKNLSEVLQEHLLNSYYSTYGIEYSLGRIPMASCDFSTRIYTYADVPGDFNLTHFQLAAEDFHFKIPVIKSALSRSKRKVKLFGSPWSAPAWMKNSNSTIGGELIGEAGNNYHKTWASYFVKFLDAYKQNGVNLWGLTVQNEPTTGYLPGYTFQSMGFTGSTERDFVKSDLGPALVKAGYNGIKLMIFDGNRIILPFFPYKVLEDSAAAKYVSGVAVHWYEDTITKASWLSDLRNKYPDFFILGTEACTGFSSLEVRGPVMGSWKRGERYSHDIIEDLENWVTGWTDWNLALNTQGGPNWVKNFVDSPIIVDSEQQVFYKQPMFYHLGHFSKFIPPGSFRVNVKSSSSSPGLQFVSFLLPDGSNCAVVLNQSGSTIKFTINVGYGYINSEIKASSIRTYLWSGSSEKIV